MMFASLLALWIATNLTECEGEGYTKFGDRRQTSVTGSSYSRRRTHCSSLPSTAASEGRCRGVYKCAATVVECGLFILIEHHVYFWTWRKGMRMQVSCIAAVSDKSLRFAGLSSFQVESFEPHFQRYGTLSLGGSIHKLPVLVSGPSDSNSGSRIRGTQVVLCSGMVSALGSLRTTKGLPGSQIRLLSQSHCTPDLSTH